MIQNGRCIYAVNLKNLKDIVINRNIIFTRNEDIPVTMVIVMLEIGGTN